MECKIILHRPKRAYILGGYAVNMTLYDTGLRDPNLQ